MKPQELTLYRDLLGDIKRRVRQAQHRAALFAIAEMTYVLGHLSHDSARQKQEGWAPPASSHGWPLI